MKRLFCLFWLSICVNLFAENEPQAEDPFVSSLVDTQSLVSTLVEGSISAITGHLVEAENDFVIAGPDPLSLSRMHSLDRKTGKGFVTYPQGVTKKGSLGYAIGYFWHFNRPEHLSQEFELQQASGTRVKFKEETSTHSKRRSWILAETRGLTNCASREISARTNLNNLKLHIDESNNSGAITSGSGRVVHFYCPRHKAGTHFSTMCLSEKHPSGNQIFFEWNRFYATNHLNQEYASLNFEYQPQQNELDVTSSDNKWAKYKFFNHKIEDIDDETCKLTRTDRWVISEIEYKHKPTVKYDYGTPLNDDRLFLTQISYPDNRTTDFTYNRFGRIIERRTSIGNGQKKILSHLFEYFPNVNKYPDGSIDKKRELKGYTNVFDADMHKTTYLYNKEMRPLGIQRYTGKSKDKKSSAYQLYCWEEYVWDDEYIRFEDRKRHLASNEDPKEDEMIAMIILNKDRLTKRKSNDGNLVGKYLKDGNGNIHSARYFEYDDRGNVLKDTLYGNLTGKNNAPVQVDVDKHIIQNGVECYSKQFTFSNDGFNLPLSEAHDNGKKIVFEYKPNTNLVTKKILYHKNKQVLTEEREYDDNAALAKLIKKDPYSTRITYFNPRVEAPVGLPAMIEEKYWDNGNEILLKRVICTYSIEGHLIKQEHHDSEGFFCYTLEWEYDDHGNVTAEKDAVGQVVKKEYDQNDNLIREIGPGYTVKYEYDVCDHLTGSEKIADHDILTTSYQYNHLGQQIASTDYSGQKTTYEYDDLGRLIKTIFPEVPNENGQLYQASESIQYDIVGNATQLTDARGHSVSKSYNIRNKPTLIHYPDGTNETFEYNLDGTLAYSIARNGTKTVYETNALGQIVSEKVYSKDGGLLTFKKSNFHGLYLNYSKDPEGHQTTYSYDKVGRLAQVTCEDHQTNFAYDT